MTKQNRQRTQLNRNKLACQTCSKLVVVHLKRTGERLTKEIIRKELRASQKGDPLFYSNCETNIHEKINVN